jgi:undecaprenyl-diphosphatase
MAVSLSTLISDAILDARWGATMTRELIARTPRAVVSGVHWLETGENRMMRTVNRWRPPRWMRIWMIAATRGGDGWLWYAMGLVVALFGGPERFLALGAATASAGVGIGLFLKLKRVCARKRPCAIEPHCWATLLPPDQFSFPSGHTITAFAVAISLGAFYPALLAGLLFCAASVAASRILLGMHYLSDVIAGAGIGGLLGYAAVAVFRSLA